MSIILDGAADIEQGLVHEDAHFQRTGKWVWVDACTSPRISDAAPLVINDLETGALTFLQALAGIPYTIQHGRSCEFDILADSYLNVLIFNMISYNPNTFI